MAFAATLIRDLRLQNGYPLRVVAAYLGIDQAILSKMERGQRKISREQVLRLARFYKYDEKEMLVTYLSDRILSEIESDKYGKEALALAERKLSAGSRQDQDRLQILRQVRAVLKSFPGISKAWMYGSFARKEDRPGSDLDLAIETDGHFSYFDLAEIKHRIEQAIQRNVDIGFVDTLRDSIIDRIKPDIKLIYERQETGQ